MNIPNLLTLARAVLVPVLVWLLVTGKLQTAFFLFLLVGASDAVDGHLAKRFHWETELGAYLDPIADKLLIISTFIALGVLGELPSWLVIAVVSRDLLIVIGVMLSWLLARPVPMRPQIVSKANTVSQLALVGLVLADASFGLGLAALRAVMIWVTAGLTLVSLLAYMRTWLRHMTGYESGDSSA